MFKILSPGEKLKNFRKEIGAPQKYIAFGVSKPNFLSSIENNKERLPEETGRGYVKNLNRFIDEYKIEHEYASEEYILEDVVKQSRNGIDYYLKLIKKSDINKLKDQLIEVEKFIRKYYSIIEEKERYKIYFTVMNIYYDNECFDQCLTYIIKCIEIEKCPHKLLELKFKKFIAYYRIGFYKEAIILADRIFLENDKEIDVKMKKKLLFNLLVTYKKIGEISKSMYYIDKILEEIDLDANELLQINLIKVNYMLDNGDLENAEKCYISLEKEALKNNSQYVLFKVYNNLLELNFKLAILKHCSFIEAKKYLKLALESPNIPEREKLFTYNYAIKIYCKENDYYEIKNVYLYVLDIALNNIEFFIEIANNLYNYFEKNLKCEDLDNLLNFINKNLNNSKRREITDLFFFASNFYKKIDITKSDKYFDIGINFLNNIRNGM